MVRLGILPLGVFPSSVCRRIPGIEPVMSVKARITAIQPLVPGDCVGYGMRYTAPSPCRIAVLPLGYGDGFPRIAMRAASSFTAAAHRWWGASRWMRLRSTSLIFLTRTCGMSGDHGSAGV